MSTPHFFEALRLVEVAAAEARASGELSLFLGELERVRMEILFSATMSATQANAGPQKDCILSVAEAAKRIGRSKWWIYANKAALPLVRLPTGRYGFSEKGLERWIERRASA